MKRTSVTITDDLERALEEYRGAQDIPPRLVDVVQAALKEYLSKRGYLGCEPRDPGRNINVIAEDRR